MIFDLRGAHLGDVLLAAPAMREGDSVVVSNERYTLRSLPVKWLRYMPHNDSDMLHPGAEAGEHMTEYWLRATGRTPVRHSMQIESQKTREDIVLAPCVKHGSKRWHGWHALNDALMKQGRHTVMIGESLPRWQWIEALALARTVVCPDTGTMHMADHIGTARVIGLQLSDLWQQHAPYWDRSNCIVRDRMDDITVQDVLEKINV